MRMNTPNDVQPILRPKLSFRSQQDPTKPQTVNQGIAGTGAEDGNLQSPYAVSPSAEAPEGSVFSGSGGSTDGRSPGDDGRWSGDDVAIGGLTQAVRDLENKSTGGFAKLMVLFVSLGVFIGAGMAWWSPRMIGMLVVILLFHEAGHYIAMRCFGYRNVKMFFIPFLGAAVSGQHFNIAAWKKAIVYLAGPVPGIVAAIPLMWFGSARGIDWMFELGGISVVLNALNLLPVMPLDGGWIMHLTVFSRSPILELISRLVGIGLMLALAFFADSKYLIFITIPLVLSLPVTFRVSKLIRRLRGTPLPQPDRDEIPAGAIRMLSEEMAGTPLAQTPTPQKAALLVQIYEALIVRPPGIIATLSIWFLYCGSFTVAIVGGSTMYAMRGFFTGGMFDEDLFSSTQHHLVLDVDDTDFHLGDEPVENTLLAVARFNSPRELVNSMDKLSDSEKGRFTHVRIGSVLLASVPGKSRKQLAMEAEESSSRNDAEFDEDFGFDTIRSRMEEMLRPVDPSGTWLSPMVPVAGDETEPLPSSSRQPVVDIISGMHDSIQVSCRAPDPIVAKQIVEADFQMLGITDEHLYLPNWSPLEPPTEQQIVNRQTLRTLVDGINKTSAPKLFELKNKLQRAQYSVYDEEGAGATAESQRTRSAKLQSKTRDLDRTYTKRVQESLTGEQAEVAKLFQQYQSAMHEYSQRRERNLIELEKQRENMGDDDYYAMLDEQEDAEGEYPLMDDYLVEQSNLLGFGDPAKRSHHFAAHVSGSVMNGEQFERFINPETDLQSGSRFAAEDGDVVLIHVHRAVDQAATVAAIVGYLQRQDFVDFRLHYSTPKR